MKCNQTKCQWNIDYGCMKPMWMECPLSNVRPLEPHVENPSEAKLERIFDEAKQAARSTIWGAKRIWNRRANDGHS